MTRNRGRSGIYRDVMFMQILYGTESKRSQNTELSTVKSR